MSDWEAEYDEDGGAISKPSHVNTAKQWRATPSRRNENVRFGVKPERKMDREGPQWRSWRERDSSNGRETRRDRSTRPLTLTVENSSIGRVIGKLVLYTFTDVK